MAKYVLKDCKIFVAQYDFTGAHNSITLDHVADEVEVTNFGSDGVREYVAGLEDIDLAHEGYIDYADAAASLDAIMDARLGGAKVPITVCPTDGAANERAFFFEAPHFNYSHGGSIGEPYSFQARARGTSRLAAGTVLSDADTARTSTFQSTARQVGAVTANQKLYAVMHVIAASGTTPTLDVVVQSDDGSGFASPASQITFSQATAISSQYATPVAGAITDDWWRISATIGGTSPSFTFLVAIGIR